MQKARKILLTLLLGGALLGCLAGCGSNSARVLQTGLEQGDSLLIFPRPDSGDSLIRWQRLTDDLQADEKYVSAFADAVPVGTKYAAVTVRPGTYFIRGLLSREPSGQRRPDGKNRFDSRFGDIPVLKTPPRAYELEQVWEPAEYEKVGGRWVRVWDGYWTSRVVSKRQTSYLVSSCDFLNMPDGGPDLAASVTVGPGEVIVLPGLMAGLEIRDGSCSFKGHEATESYRRLAGRAGYTSWSGGSTAADAYFNQVYSCPVEALRITLLPADPEDLRQWVEPGDLPPGVLERAVRRELNLGRLFAREHPIRNVSREEKHLFSPNVTYRGEEHLFSGDPGQAAGEEEADPR